MLMSPYFTDIILWERIQFPQLGIDVRRDHVFFFFQAEDGIRDYKVTGVQTCALPISNHHRLSRYTGAFASLLVATYITLEAPLSGMSMNPARSFGSAFPSGIWDHF